MKKIILFQILAACTLLSSTSCSDFLDLKPEDKIDMEVAYGTPARLESATLAYYSYLSNLYSQWHTGLHLLTTTDLVEAGPATDETGGYAFYEHTTNTWAITQVWEDTYIALGNLNEVLKYADMVNWSGEDDRRRKVYGASYFFRAYMHFLLVQRYENIVLKITPNEGVVMDTAPTAKDVVYAQIVSDLDAAIDMLEPLGNSERGTVNVAAARLLRSKVALVLEDWDEALIQSEKIMDYGVFDLLDNVENNFQPHLYGELSKREDILMVSFYDEALSTMKHSLGGMCTPKYQDIGGVNAHFDFGENGRALLYPTDYLLGLYDSDDQRLLTLFNSTFKKDGKDSDVISSSGMSSSEVDMRLHICSKKYWDDDASVPNSSMWEQVESLPHYRYAEVLLIAAEAHMRLNQQPEARGYLNEIYKRANPSVTNKYDSTTITIETILEERARELCFEMGRWEDLKRTGKLLDHMRLYNPFASANVQSRHNLFPIPYRHIEYSNFQYPQNPGW